MTRIWLTKKNQFVKKFRLPGLLKRELKAVIYASFMHVALVKVEAPIYVIEIVLYFCVGYGIALI